MRYLAVVLTCVLVAGCHISGYHQFYKPMVDETAVKNAVTLKEVQTLGADETPRVFTTDNMDRDFRVAMSKGFLPIGESLFNGMLEPESAVIQQARDVGAVLVLVKTQYTDTQTVTTPLVLPNNQTTYSSGTAYGTYGRNTGSASYSGTTTTYGSTVVPMTYQQRRFDQGAVFFIKDLRKFRIGIVVYDLTMEMRTKLERNTGAVIRVILENSPAFEANVLPDDVLIEFNGAKILNARQALEVMKSAVPEGGKCPIKIIRNGTERTIDLNLPPL